MKKRERLNQEGGFTITEILVVIVLIAIIGTVIIVSLTKTNENKNNKQYQKEVESLASASSVYVDSENTIKDLLYSEDGKVTLTVKELTDAGLIKREDFSNFDDDTKITLFLDENEDVQALVDSEYTNYIKLTPTKDTIIINLSIKEKTSLVKASDVMFCFPKDEEGNETCYEHSKLPKSSEVTIDVIGASGTTERVVDAKNYEFKSAGTYAIKYVFKANGEEVTRYKYLVVYDNKCALKLSNVSVTGQGTQFSNTEEVKYEITSGSGKFFVVTISNNELTGQEIKQSSTSGTIHVPANQPDNISTIRLYCFDENSQLIGQNSEQLFVDITKPTCTSIKVDGTVGNKVAGIQYYRSNVNVSAKYGNNNNYSDNYGETYTKYVIDTNPQTPLYRTIEGLSNGARNKTVSSTKSSKNNTYYLHVVDAANNSCTINTTFNVDANKPIIKLSTTKPLVYKKLTNIETSSLYDVASDTINDPDASGVSSIVVKSKHDSYKSVITNINQLPEGKTKLLYTITDKAGNSAEYQYPEVDTDEITITSLYLWEALRDRKTCTGSSGADCPVYNEQAAYNYVTFAGRNYRAYHVNGSNITRLVDAKAFPYGTTYMACTYTYWVETCSNGAGYHAVGLKRKLSEIDLFRYLQQYYQELAKGNRDYMKYLRTYPFDNSVAGDNSVIYSAGIGGLAAKDYKQIAKCTGSTCQKNYLDMTHKHWTITPVNEFNEALRYQYKIRPREESAQFTFYYYINNANSTIIPSNSEAPEGIYFHPVVAMRDTVKVISGEGTSTNPFQLGL